MKELSWDDIDRLSVHDAVRYWDHIDRQIKERKLRKLDNDDPHDSENS